MLTVQLSPTFRPEREYIVDVLMGEFLGLDYRIDYREREDIQISAGDGRCLRVADVFFQMNETHWLTEQSLPSQPLEHFDPGQTGAADAVGTRRVPMIFLKPNGETPVSDFIPIDIFGGSFFMLSRYEEYVNRVEDAHGRFPASDSVAWRNGFLDRPIVNEYLEILWVRLKNLWPGLIRKPREFRLILTHDVDKPYEFLGRPFTRILLKSAADMYRGGAMGQAFENLRRWVNINRNVACDAFDSFDWLMETDENAGAKSVFNFMAVGPLSLNRYYWIGAATIRSLVRKIVQNGHEIGFHPSYTSIGDDRLWRSEFKRLNRIVGDHRVLGGRQHYLRFTVPDTWRLWSENGLSYDSTLTFADQAGFRCGTCYEYPVYDLEKRKVLHLRERPLIAMECSVIDDHYMGLGTTSRTVDFLLELKHRCRFYRGDFVLLWHNHRFTDPKEREMYRTVVG